MRLLTDAGIEKMERGKFLRAGRFRLARTGIVPYVGSDKTRHASGQGFGSAPCTPVGRLFGSLSKFRGGSRRCAGRRTIANPAASNEGRTRHDDDRER